MPKSYYLGIDQGTTGTTALIFDTDWNVVGKGYRELTQIYPRPGWVEQYPDEILRTILDTTDQAMAEAGIGPLQLRCLGLDNQGETCLVWDKTTGQPIHNAIVWQDRRTAGIADALAARAGDLIRERTGVVPDAYFSGTKIRWILDNVSGALRRAQRGELAAGTTDSWLIWKLTHGQAHVTDSSTASRTMLLNIHTGKWDVEIADMVGVPLDILPEIRDSATLLGTTDPRVFFGVSIPVSGSLVDQAAALFGQSCHTAGAVKTTYGTGCFMLMNTGGQPTRSRNGLLTTVGWRLDGETTFALDGGIYIAGAAVQWLRDKLNLFTNAAESEAMASSIKDTGGMYFVPAFAGLAAPHWDQYARGVMVGITGGTTKEHIVRATLESIAYQVKDNLDVMRRDSGIDIECMRVDGGMVANAFLMQFQADILGIPVDVPSISETTALGAAQMAALGAGFAYRDELSSTWRLSRRYVPTMTDDRREGLLHDWRRAVERAKAWEE